MAQLLLVLLSGIVAFGWAISLVPRDLVVHVTSVLVAWLTLSFPIGVLVGHCALNEVEGT